MELTECKNKSNVKSVGKTNRKSVLESFQCSIQSLEVSSITSSSLTIATGTVFAVIHLTSKKFWPQALLR